MNSKRTVEKELAKVKKVYFNTTPESSGEWRTAFDQGVMQALSWVLGKAEKPHRGFELRLLRQVPKE